MSRKLIYTILSIFITLSTYSQSVTIEARLDSLHILIGEQTKIQLEVAVDADKRAFLPALADTLVKGIEVLEISRPDTQYLNNRQRMVISQEYLITSFDSALYYIPPFEVMVDSTVYLSKPLALKVYTVPVDTLHPEIFFGQKTIIKAPFSWEDWSTLVFLSLLCLPLLALVIYLIIRLNDNKPIIRTIKVEPKLPAHEQAILTIEQIKSKKTVLNNNPKEYYTLLTDAIRTYIKERFGFNALEMTSSEIIEELFHLQEKEAIKELQELFRTADLVKFAKHVPFLNENDANLIYAVDFINTTKVEADPNAPVEPTEITIEEKRSRKAKLVLAIAITVTSVIIISLLIWIGKELYNQF